ncbi:MAG: TonB family protein [Rhodocyclaceae bacterium]|nr:MAG: TonB family protein [Rhodocyclaceae bacterium]
MESSTAAIQYRQGRSDQSERLAGIAITVILHGAVLWGLFQIDAVRRSVVDAAPIMVNFITPPQAEEPPRPATAPEHRPVQKTTPPPVLTTQAPESPSPIIAPPAPKAPQLPPMDAQPAPTPVVPPSFGAAYLHNPTPTYPPLSRRMGEEGKVLLRVFVSAAGGADKVEIERSSGSPRLDAAAQASVRSWRFVPARQGSQAVPAWVIVPIQFSLEG